MNKPHEGPVETRFDDDEQALCDAADLTSRAMELIVNMADRLMLEARPIVKLNRDLVNRLKARQAGRPGSSADARTVASGSRVN